MTHASESISTRHLHLLAKCAGAATIALGVLALSGWGTGLLYLASFIRGAVAMNPMTAICLVLCGVALLFKVETEQPRASRAMAHILALCVLTVGALKLAEYFFSLDIGMDQWLFKRAVIGSARLPNEMAPNTAINFVFIAMSLLCLDHRSRSALTPCQMFALAVGAVALVAVIGYSYRVLSLYQVGSAIPMALPTGLAFMALALGVFALRPRAGFMAVVTSRTTGGALARRLLPLTILAPWAVGAVQLAALRAGYHEVQAGIALFTCVSIGIFAAVVWCNARLLHSSDLERMRADNQLRSTSSELQRSNTELEQFASIVSHDLFEPLRMVVSYLQLLSGRHQKKLDPEAQEFIGFAVDGALRMQGLIDALLAYSRVGRGRPLLPMESSKALADAVANLKIPIDETQAAITHGPLPKVQADAVQLTQVFQNLIGNALKFRGPAPPAIEVNARDDNGEWVFSVQDNGLGIEPKHFDRIFVVFQRLHTRQEYPGTGMGLAICKRIIERHGGRIWVESTPGKGSTFFFTLKPAQ